MNQQTSTVGCSFNLRCHLLASILIAIVAAESHAQSNSHHQDTIRVLAWNV